MKLEQELDCMMQELLIAVLKAGLPVALASYALDLVGAEK